MAPKTESPSTAGSVKTSFSLEEIEVPVKNESVEEDVVAVNTVDYLVSPHLRCYCPLVAHVSSIQAGDYADLAWYSADANLLDVFDWNVRTLSVTPSRR